MIADPPKDTLRLLLVGAIRPELAAAAAMAQASGAQVVTAVDTAGAMALLRTRSAELAMVEVGADVAGFIAALRRERFVLPVLACGIDAPAALAVAAIRAGARDYVPLPPDAELIAAALATAVARAPAEIVGTAPALTRAVAFARSLARSRLPMLIAGEPGTGKALVARTVHAASGRPGPFLCVAAAGVTPDIVEAELWGHADGGLPPRIGKLDEAAGGTLFLRDIDRLPPATQARLAATLTGAVDVRTNVRLVASTSADLEGLAAAGAFRADLAQRFAAARVSLPALRDRIGDVAALVAHIAARTAADDNSPLREATSEALALLATHRWPGNVAELEDVVARALAIGRGVRIEAEDMVLTDGTPLSPSAVGEAEVTGLVGRTVDEVERALILKTLERCRGNRTSASGILGISVRTMRNKLKTFVEAGHAVAPAL